MRVLRTSSPDKLPDEKAEQALLAEVEALERRNRMKKLEERRALAQRGYTDGSTASSSQTLTSKIVVALSGVQEVNVVEQGALP